MSEDEARWTGRVEKGADLSDMFRWSNANMFGYRYLILGEQVYNKKGVKGDWPLLSTWPPDKVEVIVRRVNK